MNELRTTDPDVVEGCVDECVRGVVRGWARWAGVSQVPVRVEILVDGVSVGEGLANLGRGDLRRAGKGNCGFQITIDQSGITRPVVHAMVRAKDGPLLPGGSLLISLAEGPIAQEHSRVPTWFEAVRELEDGTAVDDRVIDALHEEMSARAGGTETVLPRIRLTGLRVRRKHLPEWWSANGNLLLAAPNAIFNIGNNLFTGPGFDNLVVLGDGVALNTVTTSGRGGLTVLGDHCELFACHISVIGRSTVLIGEKTTCTFMCSVDARNGGAVVVGADNMWASGIIIATDDDHAIRDVETGARLNVFGGRVIIEPHVWLCSDVRVLGNSVIGANTVVGQGSFVKSVLPPNSVCTGRPAKPVRTGITWTREDAP